MVISFKESAIGIGSIGTFLFEAGRPSRGTFLQVGIIFCLVNLDMMGLTVSDDILWSADRGKYPVIDL